MENFITHDEFSELSKKFERANSVEDAIEYHRQLDGKSYDKDGGFKEIKHEEYSHKTRPNDKLTILQIVAK